MQGLVTVSVDAGCAGQRLDRFLAAHVPSRAVARRHIDAGCVLVDGRPGRPDQRLRLGQEVAWTPVVASPSTLEPEDIALTVLFEDEHLLVIDKPAGLVVHPAAGHRTGTLVNALLGRARGGADQTRPGIVHRLDKGTSGVMVVAKSDLAYARLGEQFHAHTIERRYRAIVLGRPPAEGSMRTLYGRHPTDRKKFSSRVRKGKTAATQFRVVQRLSGATLVEAQLETGRTHQVRVHFADAGYPLLGDPTYARPPRDPTLRAVAQALGRPALHAAFLAFVHPATGKRQAFESPLPADFSAALEALKC